MKRLHIIHHKTLNEAGLHQKGVILSLLERETLDWAKANRSDAYAHTTKVQEEFLKNPNKLEISNKYFKYLRRLLELKLEAIDEQALAAGEKLPNINEELQARLNIESLRKFEFISCSQIQMYESCPRKFYWRYVRGIKFPKTHALHFGTAIDNTFNAYYDQKIKGVTMPRSAVHAQFFEEFDKDIQNVNWEGHDPKRFLKIGPKVLDAYLDAFDNKTNAIDVQTECIVHLDNGGRLIGYIDILEPKTIVDTKTAAKPWETQGKYAKHLGEIQPKAYGLWYLENNDEVPGFRYQIVTKPENELVAPQTQLIQVELKRFELEGFRRHLQNVWDSIQKAIPKGKAGFPAEAEKVFDPQKGLFDKDGNQVKLSPLCCFKYCDYATICSNDGLKIPQEYVKRNGSTPGYFIWEKENPPKDAKNGN